MTLSSEVREKLFVMIRAGMGVNTPILEISDDECASMIELATKQALLPILYRGMVKMRVPKSYIQLCDQYRLKSEYRAIQHDNSLRCIQEALDKEKIPYILLKGAVLRHLYPNIVLRTSSDIDILVKEKDINSAVSAIETCTDFKSFNRNYHDISMLNMRVHLELHFSIKVNDEKIDWLLDKAWEYSHSSGEGSRFEFSPEFQLIHVVAHMRHHFLHGGLGIRPFIDLWLLTKQTQYDECQVKKLFDQCGIWIFYEECIHLSQVWMEGEKHTETTLLFEKFCLEGGVFGNERFRIAGTQKEKRGWSYIVSRVFPSKYQVKEFYKDQSGKDHILPYYYSKRWRSWLSKERRKDLKRQINATIMSNKEYQDTADDLFKRLGLK